MKININNLDKTLTLSEMIIILGGSVDQLPVIGKFVQFNMQDTVEHDIQDDNNCAISYDFTINDNDTKTLTRIYVGHKYAGPMLDCHKINNEWIWVNLYSKGNYGKNYSHGGNWSSMGDKDIYSTAYLALKHRNYVVNGIIMNNSYTESEKLINEVKDFVIDFI